MRHAFFVSVAAILSSQVVNSAYLPEDDATILSQTQPPHKQPQPVIDGSEPDFGDIDKEIDEEDADEEGVEKEKEATLDEIMERNKLAKTKVERRAIWAKKFAAENLKKNQQIHLKKSQQSIEEMEKREEFQRIRKEGLFNKLVGKKAPQPTKISDIELAEALDYCDSNHDGFLDVDDLSVLVHNLGMKVYPAMIKELYADFANQELGTIDLAQFKKVLGRLQPQIGTLIKRSQNRFIPAENNAFCAHFSAKQTCEQNNCIWNVAQNFCYL